MPKDSCDQTRYILHLIWLGGSGKIMITENQCFQCTYRTIRLRVLLNTSKRCMLVTSGHSRSTEFSDEHDDVIKWKHFPRYWPFVRGIHRYPVNSPHKGQWRGALMFTLIWARINGWVNNCEAGDLRRNLAHYDVIVMANGIMNKMGTILQTTFRIHFLEP